MNKDKIIKLISIEGKGKRALKICPKCKDVYIILLYCNYYIDNQTIYYNPDLKYCIKCDTVFKMYHIEIEQEVLKNE